MSTPFNPRHGLIVVQVRLFGLDFFRNHVLTLDFQNGEITLV